LPFSKNREPWIYITIRNLIFYKHGYASKPGIWFLITTVTNENQVFDFFSDSHGYQLNTRNDTLRGLVAVSNTRRLWSGPQPLGVFEDHSSRVFKSAQFFSAFRVSASARRRRRRRRR
jgi:hypothetical protein